MVDNLTAVPTFQPTEDDEKIVIAAIKSGMAIAGKSELGAAVHEIRLFTPWKGYRKLAPTLGGLLKKGLISVRRSGHPVPIEYFRVVE